MGGAPAFRIEATSIEAVSAIVESFRADALRLFVGNLNRAVADEAARFVDEHRLGIASRAEGKGPLRDAVAEVRRVFEESFMDPLPSVDFDCEVRLFLSGPNVLARFEHGNGHYLRLFSSRDGVAPFDWSPGTPRPSDVKPREWKEREVAWTSADRPGAMGGGLLLRVVDGPLPAPKWTAVKKAVPDYETRVRRCARTLAWIERSGTPTPASAKEGQGFVKWLGSREGVEAYDSARRWVVKSIPGEIGRDELAAYGKVTPKPRDVPSVAEPPQPIDHADVYEASDGSVFVVVWDAGLSADERVYMNVSGTQVSFVQNGIHFGNVQNLPNAAADMLKGAGDATVVEIRKLGDRKEVKAKHVALIRSTTLSDELGASMTRWKSAAASKPAKEAAWSDR